MIFVAAWVCDDDGDEQRVKEALSDQVRATVSKYIQTHQSKGLNYDYQTKVEFPYLTAQINISIPPNH